MLLLLYCRGAGNAGSSHSYLCASNEYIIGQRCLRLVRQLYLAEGSVVWSLFVQLDGLQPKLWYALNCRLRVHYTNTMNTLDKPPVTHCWWLKYASCTKGIMFGLYFMHLCTCCTCFNVKYTSVVHCLHLADKWTLKYSSKLPVDSVRLY